MGKKKSALGTPKNKPCKDFKDKKKHNAHHHTENGFCYCDGYPDPMNRKTYG